MRTLARNHLIDALLALVATALLLHLILLFWGCQNSGPTAPEPMQGVVVDSNPTGQQVSETSTLPIPSESGGCEVVQLRRSGVKVRVNKQLVEVFVPANPTLGEGYFNVWDPELNDGKKYGPFVYNEWIVLGTFEPGNYDMRLAAETKTSSGKVYQCDTHRIRFRVESEECLKPPKPECAYGKPIYNAIDCTWTCPKCTEESVPKPECSGSLPDLGAFDPETCTWTCVCIQPEPPHCAFGRAEWQVETCSYRCPTCEEVNEPSMGSYVIDAPMSTFGLCKIFPSKHCRINDFVAQVDVLHHGTFTAKLKATSKLSEYEADTPDYVKRTKSLKQECGEAGTIEVRYPWKGHSARYWYFTLEGPGVYFKSEVIDGH